VAAIHPSSPIPTKYVSNKMLYNLLFFQKYTVSTKYVSDKLLFCKKFPIKYFSNKTWFPPNTVMTKYFSNKTVLTKYIFQLFMCLLDVQPCVSYDHDLRYAYTYFKLWLPPTYQWVTYGYL